ncbi:hypothetical protein [Helicobacter cetorum]|uniref:Uracil-DNA glycosylase-like domain-containing protein n=1 Tax=Helicobacter cetorum (strain ATCC BAA-540 / CCUG 52418 / MIT 99-5656) TaxID=1163745 RepID=I0EQE1_HELCM|nr:hypothetical protein [Helicobacter cetorum]AFI05160.1 hypothetical protein HCD_00640 [Helicobacter cetorum MIT 99-5656]
MQGLNLVFGMNVNEFNKKHGLVICGLNYGVGVDEEPDNVNAEFIKKVSEEEQSYYFPTIPFRFQKRITKWFSLWDCALESEEEKMGAFEKSLININWVDTKSKNFDDELIEHKDNFLQYIEVLEPKLLFFFGINMLEALNDERIKPYAENFLGKAKNEPNYITKPFEGKSFRVGFQSFEKCEVVAFPHPTGTIGLSDDYIALFKDDIKPLIENYRKFKGV